ncbi:XRE family transcriptional regulator [Amycolatopsis sp. NPDC051903]|uniref:XRE family transcriptional regulator n=1 Tax=Amycolatopsis sp. NPDC051903 TaxID=3363936 RepID=UPI003798859C
MYTSWETGEVAPTDWRDELCEVFGVTAGELGLAGDEQPPSPLILPATPPAVTGYGDDAYLESVRGYIQNLVSLDNRFGGADLVRLSVRFFNSLHDLIGTGAYDVGIENDLNAAAGELAEVVGWLAYDAEQHDLVRRMNQESLYYTRLAGDRTIELLTIQNASMHAGAMGRPREALQLARSVLNGREKLSPRLRALFLTRESRALAQAGDPSSIGRFDEVRSLFLEGVQDNDPAWAWWIDERELAWHEAMAKRDLQQENIAISEFEHSVEATPNTETRSQYLHRAYLLQAQVEVGSWVDVVSTVDSLIPLVSQVASPRTVLILRNVIEKVVVLKSVPDDAQTSMTRLSLEMDRAAV